MKLFFKALIIFFIAALFFLVVFILKDVVSLIVIYVVIMGASLSLIIYFTYHKWNKKVSQKYPLSIKHNITPSLTLKNQEKII